MAKIVFRFGYDRTPPEMEDRSEGTMGPDMVPTWSHNEPNMIPK